MLLSRSDVQRALPHYLRKCHPYKKGTSRLLIGHPRALPAQGVTLFAVRITDRARVIYRQARQSKARFTEGRLYPRPSYSRSSPVTYVIAAIDWRTCQVAELQAFPTKAEALAALTRC